VSTDQNDDVSTLSFETAMRELESIVAELEKGEIKLEDSITKYARGEALKKRCDDLLKNAEQRIQKITLGADGKPTGAEPLDVD
jgi:exodeoxyribonuclease VII small subunit